MEDEAPLASGDLNKIICQECGLPLKIHSYEFNKSDEGNKIIIKLFCQNLDHKKINEFNFEEYNLLVQECIDKSCQCKLCQNVLYNTTETPPYYCYTCKRIICSECLKDKHEKEHTNCFKFEDLKNKCLIHWDNKNEIKFYCIVCKKDMCINCLVENLEHTKAHDVKEINKYKEDNVFINNIQKIKNEQNNKIRQKEILLKKLENLKNEIEFQNFLLNKQNNYFHLFYDKNINIKNINNNSIINNNLNNNDPIINQNIINEDFQNKDNKLNYINNKDLVNIDNNKNFYTKEGNIINIIYHDENMKYQGIEIVLDCQKIKLETKGSLILTDDLTNLEILLIYLLKNKSKSKFFLIVNGSSADSTINFIKKNKYLPLFIKGYIYTKSLKKYLSVQKKYSDFVEKICLDCKSIIEFIKTSAEKYQEPNGEYKMDFIMNWYSYKKEYFSLHREICNFYGDENISTFSLNYSAIQNFVKFRNFSKEIKESLFSCFKIFSELNNKNYQKIIEQYLKDDYFVKTLNLLLKKKDIDIYKNISYFVGNFMHCLTEYGKKEKKGVNSGHLFFKGMRLEIVEVLEFLKNRNLKITFPYFFSIVDNRDIVEFISKRNLTEKERKNKGFYSVILSIYYLHDDGFEPCIIDLKDLAQYPDEEQYIVLPFTFMKIKKITIDSKKYIADIDLEIVGKKEILEYKIKEKKEIEFDDKNNIMFIK